MFCYINNFYFEFYIQATFCIDVYKKGKAAFESGGLLIYGNTAPWYLIAPFFFFFFLNLTLLFCTVLMQIDILVSWAGISLVRV